MNLTLDSSKAAAGKGLGQSLWMNLVQTSDGGAFAELMKSLGTGTENSGSGLSRDFSRELSGVRERDFSSSRSQERESGISVSRQGSGSVENEGKWKRVSEGSENERTEALDRSGKRERLQSSKEAEAASSLEENSETVEPGKVLAKVVERLNQLRELLEKAGLNGAESTEEDDLEAMVKKIMAILETLGQGQTVAVEEPETTFDLGDWGMDVQEIMQGMDFSSETGANDGAAAQEPLIITEAQEARPVMSTLQNSQSAGAVAPDLAGRFQELLQAASWEQSPQGSATQGNGESGQGISVMDQIRMVLETMEKALEESREQTAIQLSGADSSLKGKADAGTLNLLEELGVMSLEVTQEGTAGASGLAGSAGSSQEGWVKAALGLEAQETETEQLPKDLSAQDLAGLEKAEKLLATLMEKLENKVSAQASQASEEGAVTQTTTDDTALTREIDVSLALETADAVTEETADSDEVTGTQNQPARSAQAQDRTPAQDLASRPEFASASEQEKPETVNRLLERSSGTTTNSTATATASETTDQALTSVQAGFQSAASTVQVQNGQENPAHFSLKGEGAEAGQGFQVSMRNSAMWGRENDASGGDSMDSGSKGSGNASGGRDMSSNMGALDFRDALNSIKPGDVQASGLANRAGAADPQEIINQIVEKAKLVSTKEASSISIALRPDNLGKVEFELIFRDGTVTAKFVAESNQVKEMLETNMDMLKNSLQNAGVQVGGIEVSVGQDGSGSQTAQGEYSTRHGHHGQVSGQQEVDAIVEEVSTPRRHLYDGLLDVVA